MSEPIPTGAKPAGHDNLAYSYTGTIGTTGTSFTTAASSTSTATTATTNQPPPPRPPSPWEHNTADPPSSMGSRGGGEEVSDGGFVSCDEDNLPCGYGPFTPAVCQPLRNIKLVLFLLCIAGAIQGMIVSGFVNTSISTVEKRLSLKSTQSGLVVSMYDIASCLFLAPVSYLGGRGVKPRYLGGGVFVIGLGSLVYALPHYVTGPYVFENVDNEFNQCLPGNGTDEESSCESGDDSGLSGHRGFLLAGQFLHGAGATPLYTLGVTYLDENLETRMTSLYVGIFYCMAIVGPAVGFLLGGFFLNFYCDFDSVDVSTLSITTDSPVWVGAWWLGFLLSAALAIVTALPMIAFPKYLPGTASIRANKISETHLASYGVEPDSMQGHKESQILMFIQTKCGTLWISLKVLITNPTFMFLSLAGASEGLLLNGFAAFIPKFIESQFAQQASWAAMLVGFVTIPCGGGGTFLGGYLVKRWDLKVVGIIRMCVVTVLVCLVFLIVFLVQCPAVPFAGVNEFYGNDTKQVDSNNQLLGTCNAGCDCGDSLYQPMCGADDIIYFSPCYAGCDARMVNDTKEYFDCTCISGDRTAKEGICESDCILMPVFLAIFAVVMLFTFTTSMPALTATLRCVPDKEKSLGLGLQWIMVRSLGTIPGPILFGALIDKTCQLWQGGSSSDENCDTAQGTCYFYNNQNMSYYLMGIGLAGKALSLIFFILALWLYKPPPPRASRAGSALGLGEGVGGKAGLGAKPERGQEAVEEGKNMSSNGNLNAGNLNAGNLNPGFSPEATFGTPTGSGSEQNLDQTKM